MSLFRFARTSQPQQATGIDWGNPITRGLVFAWTPDSFSSPYAATATGTFSGSGTVRGANRFGKTIAGGTGGDGLSFNVAIPTPAVACGVSFLFVGSYVNQHFGAAATSPVGWFRNLGNDVTGITNSSGGTHKFLQVWPTGIVWSDPAVVVATTDAAKTYGKSLVGGVPYTSTTSQTGSAATANTVNVLQSIVGDRLGVTSWRGAEGLIVQWQRELSDAEMRSLSDNPWQIFQPTNRAIYPEATVAGSTYTLTADAASYSITGADASLIVNRKLIADTANIPIAGADATLTHTPIGGPTYTLTADAGSIAVNGNAATLAFNRVLTADAGSYSVAGQAVGLAFNRVLSASTANIPVAGQDATLTYTNNGFTYTLSAEAGAFSVTGQDARLAWSGEQTTYSGGYEHLGRRQTPKQRKEQRQRLGIIAQDIKEATKKVARAVIADTGRTDPVSHFEDHKAQFLQMLVDELKGYQPPDMADVISRQIRIAYAIQEQEEEELLLLLH